MMDNTVKLSFEKSLTNLAGYSFGKQIYEEQIAGKIDLDNDFTIEFPPTIKGIASSFVQGMFIEIVNLIGLSATEKRLSISSENDLESIIKNKLM